MKKSRDAGSGIATTLDNIFYALKISWKTIPKRAVSDFTIRLLYRSYSVFYTVFFIGYVLKTIESSESVNAVWLIVGISIAIIVAYDFLAAWYYNTYWPRENQTAFEVYRTLIYKKASEVDLEYFEDTDFYNKYTKASNEITNRFENVLNDAKETVIDILMNTYLFIIIFNLDTFAVIICFLPIFIKYFFGSRLNTEKFKLFSVNVDPNRKKEYIKRTVYLKDYSKELRTSNVFVLLNDKFQSSINEIISNIKKYGVKITVLDILNSGSVVIFTYFAAIIYASYRALVSKTLTIGDYVILVNAVSRLSSMLTGFTDKILKFNENSKYIANIRDFLNLKTKIPDGINKISGSLPASISFRNVTYSYTGHTEPCLKNINMEISAGEKIAIVGLNGTGKTTLVKLLMRLYDIGEGEILVNGINIKNYDKTEYRNIFSTVFQDFKIFAATIGENTLLDINENRNAEINSALKNSGIHNILFNKCGNNIADKMLTKEFDKDGLVLSGGEYQKLAISRAFIKQGGIAVLDEPSSALDPIAEKQMFENLLSACKDKTVIFISHRLSAAALADKIYVMEDGYLAEHGTHEQLMDIKGVYYNMYIKQNKVFTNADD